MDPTDTPLVLVVDDDPAVCLLVREALEPSGVSVIEAADGRRALQEFAQHKPSIVLLDVLMPELDGFATCAELRAAAGGAHVPVLMMTGLEDVESIHQAYEIGATDFITKPINYTILTYRVRYMLRAAATAKELRDNEAQLARAQALAKLGHWEWNLESKELVCSAVVEQLFALTSRIKVDLGAALLAKAHPDDRGYIADQLKTARHHSNTVRVEFRLIDDAQNTIFVHLEATFAAQMESGAPAFSGVIQDVTERRRAEEEAHQYRNFDHVTGLPNRALMKQDLNWALDHAGRYGRTLAVLTLGLDNFARINDSIGHDAGDQILKTVALKLVKSIRRADLAAREDEDQSGPRELVARIGGDEFVIILTEIKSPEDAAIVARRIREELARPIVHDGKEIVVTTSIGISAYPHDGSTSEDLLKNAGAALNHAKKEGRNRDQFYTASINARAFEGFSMESNLRKAIADEQFELWYQPKLTTIENTIVGAEALIRWRHPDLGIISPAQFIPVAEDTGLIIDLGKWVIETACRQIQAWQRTEFANLHVAINLSAAQFTKPGLDTLIYEAMATTHIPEDALELELTESLLMENVGNAVRLLSTMQDRGLRIWIDDFGTGYSSFAYLKTLPIFGLKIDRCFINDIHKDRDNASIVKSIITLARGLRLKVVAEGAELDAHVDALRAHGCDFVQGFYFSEPLESALFEDWVRAHTAGPALAASA